MFFKYTFLDPYLLFYFFIGVFKKFYFICSPNG